MVPKIEAVLHGFQLGEGPHWSVDNQCLYFVDVLNYTIHKYVPATNKHTSVSFGNQSVSLIIPVKGKKDEFISTQGQKIIKFKWNGESSEVSTLEELFEVDKGTSNVINDGKCDSLGRLWAGTLKYPVTMEKSDIAEGFLYSFQHNKIKTHCSNIGLSNGLAFDYKRKKMYYIDTKKKTVDQYDFDIVSGTINNLTEIFNVENQAEKIEGFCDGMTIDEDGNLWIAMCYGSKVIKIDPRKPNTLLQVIEFPAKYITSVAFGGPNLDELYVTSARFEPFHDIDGSLFRVTGLNVKGVPSDEANV